MDHCGLAAFDFDHTIINENSDTYIEKLLIENNKLNRTNTIFIGDDMERDIIGAYNAKIDTIYINLKNKENSFKHYKASVSSLKEITDYL